MYIQTHNDKMTETITINVLHRGCFVPEHSVSFKYRISCGGSKYILQMPGNIKDMIFDHWEDMISYCYYLLGREHEKDEIIKSNRK